MRSSVATCPQLRSSHVGQSHCDATGSSVPARAPLQVISPDVLYDWLRTSSMFPTMRGPRGGRANRKVKEDQPCLITSD
jgi:hypothetical protein